jgi:hypothetical protein
MAARIEIFDDLSGEKITEDPPTTIKWVWGGEKLALDVGTKSLKRIQDGDVTLAQLIDGSYADPDATPRPGSASSDLAETRARNARIRAWARDNGYEIGDRGRIHREIMDAYEKAHPSK